MDKYAKGPPLDLIIEVDYSVSPKYPEWGKVMHPDLETAGEAKYDLGCDLSIANSFGLSGGHITNAQQWYEYLKKNDYLKSCLGLRDGEAIRKKGIAVFRKICDGQPIPLWKSIVQRPDDDLCVPYLYENGPKLKIGWRWLDRNFNNGDVLAVCITVGYKIVNRPLEE